jgi:hypothetical protein
VIPRQLVLAAIFALYLAFVAAHYLRGAVPMWAYLLIGSGVMLVAIAIFRRERERATRSAAPPPDPRW